MWAKIGIGLLASPAQSCTSGLFFNFLICGSFELTQVSRYVKNVVFTVFVSCQQFLETSARFGISHRPLRLNLGPPAYFGNFKYVVLLSLYSFKLRQKCCFQCFWLMPAVPRNVGQIWNKSSTTPAQSRTSGLFWKF